MQPGIFLTYSSEVLCSLFLLFACSIQTTYGIGNNPELETKWEEFDSKGWFYEGERLDQGVRLVGEDIIVPSSVSSLLITCSASYPVQWIIDVPWIQELGHSRNSLEFSLSKQMLRVTNDFKDPLSYSFHAYLHFHFSHAYMSGDKFVNRKIVTGNYTCQSVADGNSLQANRYIFWEDSKQSLVYWDSVRKCTTPSCNNRPDKTVKADKDNETIIIPCSVLLPNTEVTLLKRNGSKDSDYEEIKIRNDSLQFNPKFGFILKVQELPSPYGIYKCEPTVKIGNESLIVNVTTGISAEWNSENELETKNTKYYFDEGTKKIVCCAEGFTPPIIYSSACKTKFDCESMKPRLQYFQYLDQTDSTSHPINCRSSWLEKNSGVFRCSGNGIDISRTYFYIPQHVPQTLGRGRDSLHFDHYFPVPRSYPSQYSTTARNHSSIYIGKGIEDIPKEELIAISTDLGTVTDSTLHEIYSNTTKTILRFHGSTFLFAYGVRWSIVWKNLTEEMVKAPGYMRSSVNLDFETMSQLEILITDEMAGFICHAPLLDSWEWVNKTLNINMTQPTLPLIIGPDFEDLTWNIGDTEKFLVCEAEGHPTKVSWFMPYSYQSSFNDYPEHQTKYDFEKGTVVSENSFPRITQAMNGEYICEAINEVGTSEKTVFITIQDPDKEEPLSPSPEQQAVGNRTKQTSTEIVSPVEIVQVAPEEPTTTLSSEAINAGEYDYTPNSNTSVVSLWHFEYYWWY